MKPRHTLTLNGKDYPVEGSFGLLDAIEFALKGDCVSIAARVVELPVRDVATLLHVILTQCGHELPREKIGQTIFEMGASGPEVAALRVHIYAFLRLCLSSPKERQEVEKQMGELIAELSASRGAGTSDGPQRPSGKQASGTQTSPTKGTQKPKA